MLSKSCGLNELLIGGFLITAEVKTTPTKKRKQTMTTETQTQHNTARNSSAQRNRTDSQANYAELNSWRTAGGVQTSRLLINY